MKKILSGCYMGLCITALHIVVSCFAGVQFTYAQVSAIVLQSNGTALQKAGQHLLSGQPTSSWQSLSSWQPNADIYLGQNSGGACRFSSISGNGNATWVNYIGRQNSLDFVNTGGIHLNNQPLDMNSYGVQLGTDLYRSKRNQFGLLFDYEGFITSSPPNGCEVLRSDNFNGGFYYAQVFANNSDFRALAKFGSAQHWATFGDPRKVGSESFNITCEYGKRRFPVQNISLRPYGAVDINYAHLGADQIAGIAFCDTTLTQTYLRFGTDFIAQIKRFTAKADISYSVDMVSDHLKVEYVDTSVDNLHIGRQIASTGLTGQYDLNRRGALFASYSLDAFFDRDSRPYQSTITTGYSFVW